MDDFKDKIAEAAEKAKQTGTAAMGAMDKAAEAGRTIANEAKARAADTMESVKNAAGERADAARDTLVQAGDRLAETLQNEAEQSEGVSSRLLTGLAGGVSSVTDGLRDRSLGDLMTDAKNYAMRHPGAFAVGAAVAGFALARFMRSSGNRSSHEARAADTTDRIYRDAARRTVDTLGRTSGGGHGA